MAHLKTISIATLALGALAGTAMADFTAIVGAGQGFASNEGNQAQTPNIRNMLSNIYGGAFTLVSNGRTDTGGNSVDFSNGSATGSIIETSSKTTGVAARRMAHSRHKPASQSSETICVVT